jgi:hypothetical protein
VYIWKDDVQGDVNVMGIKKKQTNRLSGMEEKY